MTMKPHCPNRNDRDLHDGWYDSDMVRLYVRTNKTTRKPGTPYETTTKRKWVGIGWYCAKCRVVTLDEPEVAKLDA